MRTTSGTGPARRSSHRLGFTLLELMLTLVVIVGLVTMLWPELTSLQVAGRPDRVADDLRGTLVGLRVRAMEEGRPYAFEFEPGTGNFRVGPAQAEDGGVLVSDTAGPAPTPTPTAGPSATDEVDPLERGFVEYDAERATDGTVRALPAPMVFRLPQEDETGSPRGRYVEERVDTSGSWERVVFRPDGRCSDTSFEIEEDDAYFAVDIRGLTGQVRVSEIRGRNQPRSPMGSEATP